MGKVHDKFDVWLSYVRLNQIHTHHTDGGGDGGRGNCTTTVSFMEVHVLFVDTGKDEVSVNTFSFFPLYF